MENYVYSVCPPKQTCYRISTYGFQIEAFLRKKFGKYVLFRGDFICNKFITIKKSGCSKKYFIKTGNFLEVTTELNQYLNDFFYKNTVFDENILALHGAAVECRQKAFIFLASTTSGKSTLASYLCSRGMGYISEDCVLVDKDNFFIYPYSTPIHLREGGADVLRRKNIFPKENLDFILDDAFYERWDFRFVYMPSHVISKPVQLGAIFLLHWEKRMKYFLLMQRPLLKNC